MNAIGSRSNTLLLWLVAFAAVAAVIGWETDWGRGLTRAPEIPAAAAPAPVALALLPDFKVEGGLAERQQTVERPVFVPTRRPAPPPPPPAQEAAKPRIQRGQFQLTGTAVVDQKSVAFLREAAGGKARTVRVGETINGLLVAEVKPDRVKLTLGDESEELVLKVAAGPRTTVQPVQPAAAAPLPGQPGGPPVAGTVPSATAAGGAVPGQPPGAQPAADAEASLLERRRAARAAQAAAESAARNGQTVPPALPSPPATAAPAATPSTPDPAWAEVYRRMQQPRR